MGSVTLWGATAIVIGNMIGTGVFTSLGFQVRDIESGFVLLLLWALGGLLALCGALCYGELASALPRSGGEYHFLSRIYHPAAGFLSGWISATVGFAAPVALSAMAFGRYLADVVPISPLVLSCGILLLATAVHLWSVDVGSRFQNLFSFSKVILILVLIVSAFILADPQPVRFVPRPGDFMMTLSTPFAVSLVFVMYAYSGWNASTYITDEVRDARRVVPLSLLLGTLVVGVLYVGLNLAFLWSAPIDAMAGKVEVGAIAAREIFGDRGGDLMALLICFGLISSVSAMTWAGPRVAMTMGEDYRLFAFLGRKSRRGVPYVAVLWQGAVALVLLLTATFESVLVYIELVLIASSFLTVLGVFVLRIRHPELPRPYRTWGYPVTPLFFLAISVFMGVHVARDKPVEALWGVGTLVVGVVLYAVAKGYGRPKMED